VEGDEIKIEIYAKGLSLILGQLASDKDKNFTVISLHSRLMATPFDKEM
jgi:hypothetical protein